MEVKRDGDDELSARLKSAVATGDLDAVAPLIGPRVSWGSAATAAYPENVDFYMAAMERQEGADPTLDERLQEAVKADDEEAIRGVLADGALPEDLLLTAASDSKPKLVDMALDLGADIDCVSRYLEETPLIAAASYGSKTTLAKLLDAGADMNAETPHGVTAFRLAVVNNKPAIVEFLVARGADPNSTDEKGNPLLFKAIEYRRAAVVKALIRCGADANLEGASGGTAWGATRYLAAKSEAQMQKILLDAGFER